MMATRAMKRREGGRSWLGSRYWFLRYWRWSCGAENLEVVKQAAQALGQSPGSDRCCLGLCALCPTRSCNRTKHQFNVINHNQYAVKKKLPPI